MEAMAHPYPPRSPHLLYLGTHHYFLTFCTDQRSRVFIEQTQVALVHAQILRAARETRFEISAYCYMPDHLHLIVAGLDESSDAKVFISRSKQYSGYYFKQAHGVRLWQRYGFERVVRDDNELALTVGYIVGNPVRAGLVGDPSAYPFLGSDRYTLAELLLMCEYGGSAD
jgi:putative transposase